MVKRGLEPGDASTSASGTPLFGGFRAPRPPSLNKRPKMEGQKTPFLRGDTLIPQVRLCSSYECSLWCLIRLMLSRWVKIPEPFFPEPGNPRLARMRYKSGLLAHLCAKEIRIVWFRSHSQLW